MNKKEIAAKKACEYVKAGMLLGLGTGSTVYYFIEEIGRLVKEGLDIKCVATSIESENHAKRLNIPILSIDDVTYLDLDVDGADEVDSNFNAIKGGGGALFREKIIANISKKVIFIVDDSKVVDKLGVFPLPVEIAKFGYKQTIMKLQDYNPVLRTKDNVPFITDNGNYIIDLHLGKGFNIEEVNNKLNNTIGVFENGLFLNMCSKVIVGTDNGVKVIKKD
ncbi:MAG TPA: ribose-5-phosphate isomerase RpiA [Acholeplasmataceae bacterium]|nr:ribose-5-phosphate isomerase RpiA [Acholeplasmataceae bacterium]